MGVEVTYLNTDTKTHYGHLEQHGDMDVARAGWIADYKDPENFLALCKTGTGNNYSDYSNKEYDDLMAKAAAVGRSGRADEGISPMPKPSAWRAIFACCRCSTTATTTSSRASSRAGKTMLWTVTPAAS